MAKIIRLSCRVYAVLLFLYPSALRREFGEEMLEVFEDQLRDACRSSGWLGAMDVWCCVGEEALRTAVSSHLQIAGISLVSGLTAFALMCSFFWVMHF